VLSLVLAAAAGVSALAQEKAVELVPREEMIDAIIDYAASGGCDIRRNIFGPAFDAECKTPDAGSVLMTMWSALDRLPERELMALCRRNQIPDCEKPREHSKGRSILTFESAFDVDFNAYRATWSPDGRLLLLDGLNLPAAEVRVLDVAAGKLSPPLYAGPIHDAAWSPDGTHIALSDRRRTSPEEPLPVGTVRLYAASTRKQLARTSVADVGCSLGLLEGMAFTADSKALWVLCSQVDKTAMAVKLRVPELKVEDSFVPVSPNPSWSEIYWEEGILRHSDDLIVTARYRSPTPLRGPRSAVQSFGLRTRQPIYAPIPAVASARLAPDLSGLYIGNELWGTRSGRRVATGIKPEGRYLGAFSRLPQLGMHIEARPRPRSRRGLLAVVKSTTGATVQEIGGVPIAVAILVSPNGRRVAVAGFHEIRVYRVSPEAGSGAAAVHGR
jgi:hypothetical protein